MLPFHVELGPGESPYRQVVYAATRAVVSGELPAGATFPSVRELSQALKINPNTAHKVVAELVRAGLLDVRPGIGTVVTAERPASAAERRALLTREVEQLVVEARRLNLEEEDVVKAVSERWSELFGGLTGRASTGRGPTPDEHPSPGQARTRAPSRARSGATTASGARGGSRS